MPKTSRPEVVIGRSIALCVHPHAAWRSTSAGGRLLIFTAYVAASYAVILTFMLLRA